jgi:hypothetical protein
MLQSHVLPPVLPAAPPSHHYHCHNHLQKLLDEWRKKRSKEGGFINGLIVMDGQKTVTGCFLFAISKLLKGNAIPLQAWRVPEYSRRLRLPDLKTIGT